MKKATDSRKQNQVHQVNQFNKSNCLSTVGSILVVLIMICSSAKVSAQASAQMYQWGLEGSVNDLDAGVFTKHHQMIINWTGDNSLNRPAKLQMYSGTNQFVMSLGNDNKTVNFSVKDYISPSDDFGYKFRFADPVYFRDSTYHLGVAYHEGVATFNNVANFKEDVTIGTSDLQKDLKVIGRIFGERLRFTNNTGWIEGVNTLKPATGAGTYMKFLSSSSNLIAEFHVNTLNFVKDATEINLNGAKFHDKKGITFIADVDNNTPNPEIIFGFKSKDVNHADYRQPLILKGNSGYVGIGVRNPRAKLHVHGNSLFNNNLTVVEDLIVGSATSQRSYARIYGTAMVKEVHIDPDGNWADFVFENNYELTPLEEVASFIQENKHLPDVPSAQQVEKEGYNQSEINALFLQKIEELTLYVIDLKKENKELREAMQHQKK